MLVVRGPGILDTEVQVLHELVATTPLEVVEHYVFNILHWSAASLCIVSHRVMFVSPIGATGEIGWMGHPSELGPGGLGQSPIELGMDSDPWDWSTQATKTTKFCLLLVKCNR